MARWSDTYSSWVLIMHGSIHGLVTLCFLGCASTQIEQKRALKRDLSSYSILLLEVLDPSGKTEKHQLLLQEKLVLKLSKEKLFSEIRTQGREGDLRLQVLIHSLENGENLKSGYQKRVRAEIQTEVLLIDLKEKLTLSSFAVRAEYSENLSQLSGENEHARFATLTERAIDRGASKIVEFLKEHHGVNVPGVRDR